MVISVETKGNWSFFAPKNKTILYKERLNASAAEEFCVNHNGHLASVGSQEEQDLLYKVKNGKTVWLGGRRKAGGENKWEWLDGRPWTYQNWYSSVGPQSREPKNSPGYDCMY